MNSNKNIESFLSLKDYVEKEGFKGWDPFDGLNSSFFQALPVKEWRIMKLAWIQLFKRNPFNLRTLFNIQKDYNAKGIGLFLFGYCQLYKIAQTGNHAFGSEVEILSKIHELASLIIELQSEGYQGACWGYNFDWQNRVFFQPKYTPTVVATSFVAHSLFEAYETTKKQEYLDTALSSCDFIVSDLNRSYLKDGHFIFSYSPLDHSQVYNASLLGARLLAQGYQYTQNQDWFNLSQKAIETICSLQDKNGAWVYGSKKNQQWIDSFHTGYNLECIYQYQNYTKDYTFSKTFDRGMDFYLNNFFLKNGTPKYYQNKTYPIDIHCPAQFLVTLIKTDNMDKYRFQAQKVLDFTIQNMQDPKGYFYYQLKKIISSKIPYMRWAQAWMFYAFSMYYLYHLNVPVHNQPEIED